MTILRSKQGTLYTEVPIGPPDFPEIVHGTLRLTARGVRQERTGVHATVGIWWGNNQLEFDHFNVERNEERRKLCKGAWNLLPEDERGIRNCLPLDNLKAELDLFCENLWDAHIGRVEVEAMTAPVFHPRRMIGPYLVEEGGTILFGEPGGGKALALDTPIPTPSGWTTMGELRPGDQVFDENGEPCNVVAVSPVWTNRPVYRVATDSGDCIIADAAHEWLVNVRTAHTLPLNRPRKRPDVSGANRDKTHCPYGHPYTPENTRRLKQGGRACRTCASKREPRTKVVRDHIRIMTTAEISKVRRPLITRAEPLVLPPAALPIDPYVLGVWLGDGTGREAAISQGAQDMTFIRSEVERAGHETTLWKSGDTFGVRDLKPHLDSLGLTNNKHIPGMYLRADTSQRLSLLQGLVDTDGHVDPRGRVEFTSTERRLAEGVRELVASLGRKVSLREKRATLYGKDCGPRYTVNFFLRDAARLPRKAALCRDATHTTNHYITATPAGRADTRCIQVDSPSHLFLAGRSMVPTHNSWITYLLAQSVNAASTMVWDYVKRGHRPLLVNLERSKKDVESRLWTINRALGIDGEEYPLDVINGRGMSLKDVEGAVTKHIEKHGNDVLFLDSISRIGLGSMNRDEVANEAMDMLNRLCPTWFAIAHQAKGGKDPVTGEQAAASTFGSQMWRAACDLEVQLLSDASRTRIIVDLIVRKKNIPVLAPKETLYLEMDDRGLLYVSRPDDWSQFKKTG